MVFIGGFLHKPNIDAVEYFIFDIWPLIHEKFPELIFKIIGSDAPQSLINLNGRNNIQVLGFVEDLAPIFDCAIASVAPIRYGAGIKGKIGTSLAFGVPVLGTKVAVEGMGLVPNYDVLLVDKPTDYVDQVQILLNAPKEWESLSKNGVDFVENFYSVKAMEKNLTTLIVRGVESRLKCNIVDLPYFTDFNDNLPISCHGFSSPEAWGIWCIRQKSTIKFFINNYENVNKLNFDLYIQPFLPKPDLTQKINFHCNNQFVFQQEFDGLNFTQGAVSFSIGSSLIKSSGGYISLDFELSHVYRPEDFGISDDRLLSFLLSSISITSI